MLTWLMLAAAGFVAGVINAVAGGGSLVSFPALLFTGMPSVTANATNTLALWPGSLSSVWAYRGLIREERRRAVVLAWPSMLGGLGGSAILLATPDQLFSAVVPWLIVFACALLSLQGPLSRWLQAHHDVDDPRVPPSLWLAQLLIAIYGGYFGAGIGILMLAALGVFVPTSLQHANALKVLFATLINGVATLYFLGAGAADLPVAGVMACASVFGGYFGAHLAQRLPARLMRIVVVTYGLVIAAVLWQRG